MGRREDQAGPQQKSSGRIIGVRDGGQGGQLPPPPFGLFVDNNWGRESKLFWQNTIDV